MGAGCQRNGYWLANNHLSARGLVQPIKELSSVAGQCAGRNCALIRQLANLGIFLSLLMLEISCFVSLCNSGILLFVVCCFCCCYCYTALSSWCVCVRSCVHIQSGLEKLHEV